MSSWEFFDYLLENVQIVGTPGSGFGKNGEAMPEGGDGATPPEMPEGFDGTNPPQMPAEGSEQG